MARERREPAPQRDVQPASDAARDSALPAARPSGPIDGWSAALGAQPETLQRLDRALVQMRAAIAGQQTAGDASVRDTAARGVAGSGTTLPHGAQIQASFGAHDVSQVRAHVGGQAGEAARAIGAKAYATGQDVAFASQPDVHTAAHEAAHVVQQRGGVQLSGGVGKSGDAYERQADAVADAVVAGRSAEPLLGDASEGPISTAGPVQRTPASEVEGNVMAPGADRETLMQRVQERLVQLGHLEEGSFTPGERDEATETAIRAFQQAHAEEIAQIEGDAGRISGGWRGSSGRRAADAGEGHSDGDVAANDATVQAMANAFPRDFFGVELENEADAYNYIRNQATRLGFPFDRERVNIIGIRGFQGGQQVDNDGVRRRRNLYNDTMVILCLDERRRPRLREFKGTTDPGGRTSAGGGEDGNTYQMEANQQLEYRYRDDARYKGDLPTLGPDEDVTVVDRSGEGPRRRTEHGVGTRVGTGEGRQVRRPFGIALHAGGSSEMVQAYSTGCQVVHGSWWGSFTETIRRALTWQRLRPAPGTTPAEPPQVPTDPQQLEDEGRVVYSLINGSDLTPPYVPSTAPAIDEPIRMRSHGQGVGMGPRSTPIQSAGPRQGFLADMHPEMRDILLP